jgi:2-polyprenyl-6-methoxyphenol hydroxylase-like FAD-dependent oxidoreductase
MRRVLVVGGSLGGLMAANLLFRAGLDVTLLEKSTASLDGRGAGIVTHLPLQNTLKLCGVPAEASLGIAIEKRVVLDLQGQTIAQTLMPQVLTSWSRLYSLLMAAFPQERYIRGASLKSLKQHANGVKVTCEDGTSYEADVLIASDGIRSTVRAALAPDIQAEYAGYVAWRGVCDESVLSNFTLETLFETFGFGLPAGEQIIGYPVAGQGNSITKGQRRYNFVWYRPAPDNGPLQDLMTDADGQHHPLGLPPNKVSWRHVASARQAARELLAPQFAEILEKTPQPFLQPIFDAFSTQLAFGRVGLMGDAGFVARPHVGMGVTKAAEDALALCDALVTHGATPEALQAYESKRLRSGQSVVERGRRLGTYMQASATGQTALRDANSVMQQTAVDLSTLPAGVEHPAQPILS